MKAMALGAALAAAAILAGCGDGAAQLEREIEAAFPGVDFDNLNPEPEPENRIIPECPAGQSRGGVIGGPCMPIQILGPGHTPTIEGTQAALSLLYGQKSYINLTPVFAKASCRAGPSPEICDTDGGAPNVSVTGEGLRHPRNMRWAVPTDVGSSQYVVGEFSDEDGNTLGAWGQWSYAYTTRGDLRNRSRHSTRRHGTASGNEDRHCAETRNGCHYRYYIANHGGVLYEGTPTGAATYRGRTYAGILGANDSRGSQTVISGGGIYVGDAAITADFDQNLVNARFHNFSDSAPRELRNGITFSGIPIITSSGQFRQETGDRYIEGGFYGFHDQETAGKWYVNDSRPTRRTCGQEGNGLCREGNVIIGSFVGKDLSAPATLRTMLPEILPSSVTHMWRGVTARAEIR